MEGNKVIAKGGVWDVSMGLVGAGDGEREKELWSSEKGAGWMNEFRVKLAESVRKASDCEGPQMPCWGVWT